MKLFIIQVQNENGKAGYYYHSDALGYLFTENRYLAEIMDEQRAKALCRQETIFSHEQGELEIIAIEEVELTTKKTYTPKEMA